MTLFEAPTYDPRKARRRNLIIAGVILLILILGALAYVYRNFPEERVANKFFAALQEKNYQQAYAIWMHDPDWKQHPQNYSNYPFNEFYQDWGPSGEWGPIQSYHIDGTASGGTGVVIQVTVNNRKEKKARVWVENKSKTMTFSPY